jgi:hypothetical protein
LLTALTGLFIYSRLQGLIAFKGSSAWLSRDSTDTQATKTEYVTPFSKKKKWGFDEAKYMIVACSAFVNLLISKAEATGLFAAQKSELPRSSRAIPAAVFLIT